MKLRNKKTGELVDAWSFYDGNESVNLKYFTDDGQVNLEYRSLAELNEDWEDYKPTEPLIKDEKIRKAVKAWAEANDVKWVKYSYDGNSIWYGDNEIGFKYLEPLALELNELYDIAELCGEEDE